MIRFLFRLPALAAMMMAASMAACLCAHAQQNGSPQQLYLDALQSIAEGRQTDASEALVRMIEQEPQHAGAWLDLAIIQCELGKGEEAERLFRIIETRFSPPPVILEVIASQRAKGCKAWQPLSRTSVTIGRGSDSNVNQGSSNPTFNFMIGDVLTPLTLSPENLPQKDQYTIVTAEHMRELSPNGTLGYVQMRATQNDSLSAFNTASLVGGVEHPWRLGGWGVRGSGVLALHTLGGKLYQTQTQAQVRATPPLKLPKSLQFSLIGGLSHVEYPTLEGFDANTLEVRGALAYRGEKTQGQASLGYLIDHATGSRPGGDRTGWYASLQARTRIAENVFGEAGWTRQTWLSDTPYSPGLIDQIRDQKTQVLRGALVFPVAPRQSIQVELRKVRNDENISVFQYNSRQLQVSWQWQDF